MEGSVQNSGLNSGFYNVGVQNPYLKFAGNQGAGFDSVYDPFLFDVKFDCTEFSYVNPKIEEKYNDVLNKQGIVGKVWDFAKNSFGSKMGSNAVTKKLEIYKKGLVTEEEIVDTINKYAKGQQKALDFVADWGSTIVGAGAFALAVQLFRLHFVGPQLVALYLRPVQKGLMRILQKENTKRPLMI